MKRGPVHPPAAGPASGASDILDATAADYPLSAATADPSPLIDHMLVRARSFAAPLIADETLDTGENTLAHADAVAAIVAAMGGSEAMQAASYLVYTCQHLNRPQEVIAKVFGDNFAALAVETTKLVNVQKQARSATAGAHSADGGADGLPVAADGRGDHRDTFSSGSRSKRRQSWAA